MGKLLTVFFIFMHLFSIKCMGMVISISLLWNGNHSPNIQAGSIVQVLAYSSAAEPPVADPDESFNEVGDDIYDPFSTPDGHDIVYETSFYRQGNTYRLNETFEIFGMYNLIYLRIFSATGFEEEITLSYWGLGSVSSIRSNRTTSVYMNYNQMNQQDNFGTQYFEVIPEPTTSLLMILTGPLIFYAALKGRRKGSHGELQPASSSSMISD